MKSKDYICDKLGLSILSQLQDDGRKSYTDIAKELNVSINTVRNRVMVLMKQDTLSIFGRINPHHVGFHAPATIHIKVNLRYIEDVISQLSQYPEVSWLATVLGDSDIVMDVMCKDVENLTEVLTKRIPSIKGVIGVKTYFILKINKIAQPDLDQIMNNLDDDKSSESP